MSGGNETKSATSVLDVSVNEVERVVKKFLSREDWLNSAGKLREEEHYVEGLGYLLLSEISGDVRADIVTQQSTGFLADLKKIDAKGYQRQLLLNGVMDSETPEGARKPLFRSGDIEQVMKIGGSKIAEVIDVIERLSSLGSYGAQADVAKNSESTQNGASTS